jgi:hypothetical protein
MKWYSGTFAGRNGKTNWRENWCFNRVRVEGKRDEGREAMIVVVGWVTSWKGKGRESVRVLWVLLALRSDEVKYKQWKWNLWFGFRGIISIDKRYREISGLLKSARYNLYSYPVFAVSVSVPGYKGRLRFFWKKIRYIRTRLSAARVPAYPYTYRPPPVPVPVPAYPYPPTRETTVPVPLPSAMGHRGHPPSRFEERNYAQFLTASSVRLRESQLLSISSRQFLNGYFDSLCLIVV